MIVFALWAALAVAAPTEAQAKYIQLDEQMQKLASRNAWNGVEETWKSVVALGEPIGDNLYELAASAARMRGDAWGAYQRYLDVIRHSPEDELAHSQMKLYRDNYGRLTVRRVELTPIKLETSVAPFEPDARQAIVFAQEQLDKTGGFDGMLPIGNYVIGTYQVQVGAGLEPVVVQRVIGDGK